MPVLQSTLTPTHQTAISRPSLLHTHVCRYHTDPSGTYVRCQAKAIGSGSEGAQSALQEHFRKDMTLAEAEVLALTTLKQVMEEKVGPVAYKGDQAAESGCFKRGMARRSTAWDVWVRPQQNLQSVAQCTPPALLQITSTNVDIAKVAPKFHLYTQAEVEGVMGRL